MLDTGAFQGSLDGPRLTLSSDGVLSQVTPTVAPVVTPTVAPVVAVANGVLDQVNGAGDAVTSGINEAIQAQANVASGIGSSIGDAIRAKLDLIRAKFALKKAIKVAKMRKILGALGLVASGVRAVGTGAGNALRAGLDVKRAIFVTPVVRLAGLKRSLINNVANGVRTVKAGIGNSLGVLPIKLTSGTLTSNLKLPQLSLGPNGDLLNLDTDALQGSIGGQGLTIDENGVIKLDNGIFLLFFLLLLACVHLKISGKAFRYFLWIFIKIFLDFFMVFFPSILLVKLI